MAVRKHFLEAEDPRRVFLDACAEIAGVFLPMGFHYARSGPRLTRKVDDRTERIWFQSSTFNKAGASVCMRAGVWVADQSMIAWQRETNSPFFREDGVIAAGPVSNLKGGDCVEWDLADEGTRMATLRHVQDTLLELAVPFFEALRSPEAITEFLLRRGDPGVMALGTAVDVLVRSSGREAAGQFLRSELDRRPVLRERVEKELSWFKQGTRPAEEPTGVAMEVIQAMSHYALDIGL